MKKFNKYATLVLPSVLSVLTLTGCGEHGNSFIQQFSPNAQQPIDASAQGAKSWMVRTASSQNLLYVSSPHLGNVYVYNYSKGKLVGTLTGLFEPLGECVDKSGNVFVVTQGSTSSSGSNVYEYAHGGSSPIAILSEPGYAEGCAVDPKTGNLAVANIDDANNPYYNAGDVAIYTSAQGNPTMYYTSQFAGFVSCGYDDSSNLYLGALPFSSGRRITLARLSNGSKSISAVSLDKNVYSGYLFVPSVQWDGGQMTISTVPEVEGRKGSGLLSIYQLQVTGSTATVVGTTNLKYKKDRHRGQTWIVGDGVIGIDDYKGGKISTWSYPAGGSPQSTITSRQIDLWGVAMSPSQTH